MQLRRSGVTHRNEEEREEERYFNLEGVTYIQMREDNEKKERTRKKFEFRGFLVRFSFLFG